MFINPAKIKSGLKKIIAKKVYLEFAIALLTLPMLITVLIINLKNINNSKQTTNPPTPTQTTAPVIQVVVPSEATKTTTKTPSPNPTVCKKEIGQVSITSISDNQIINKDPVNIDISYNKDVYCALVWSYRINGGNWSDYDDKLISLYNLTPGDKQLEVKVKSIASGNEIILKKNFVYQLSSSSITPTTSTTSATQQ